MEEKVSIKTPDTERWTGIVFTFLSTFCYGISNVAVRYLTNYDEIDHHWILFYKESIGLSILIPWLLLRWGQGRFRYTSIRLMLYVFIAAIICEVVGARLQVLGYDVIGLIVSVPLIQSSTLLGIALLGHFVLGDLLSRQRKIAILILLVAVAMISWGKEMTVAQGQTNSNNNETASSGLFLLVALGTIVAGTAYSVYIMMLRYVIRKHWTDSNSTRLSFKFRHWIGHDHTKQQGERFYSPFPVTLLMSIVFAVGVVYFGFLLYNKGGIAGFYSVPDDAWKFILISGCSNAAGFFFQVQGLRMTSAVQASIIMISQMVLLSLIGFFFFHEPVNTLVLLGIFLTVSGVLVSVIPAKNTARQ